MTTAPHRRAALYLRLSEKSEESTSIDRQEADLRHHAEREGWEIAEVLVDEGISGRRSRERADRAVAMLRSGEVDVLAVWKFDRFSRQGLGALGRLIEALDERPAARFVALKDGLSSDAPAWRIVASVLAEVARMEAENTSTRVSSSVAALRRAGRFAGGTPPIGYTSTPAPDGPGRVLVPDPVAAPVLREAAERIVAGESAYSVTQSLNASGVRPPRAKSWSVQALTQALAGHAIVGRVKVKGEILTDADGVPLQVWEPVLPLDVWRTVGATLRARKAKRAPVGQRASSRSRLLSGVASCAACGGPLYVRPGGEARATVYACGARSNGRPCPGTAVTAERLEEHVASAFLGLFGSWAVTAPREVEAPTLALAEVEEAIAATTDAMRVRGADRAVLLARLDALDARREVLVASAARPAEVEYVDTGETMREVWDRGDTLARRDLLTSAIEYVAVSKGKRGAHGLDPARVEIGWRFDEVAAEAA
ncbi:recombinase family protein [Actinotalea sp. Marseille-Q4924]|uniref:recombinase family protein n=1 Tax=Actinotalea sp. Marseille-Q4924 TaxID=2866571 RepID=UPI001CE43558|nr:recombinase family protein [Actinotalea sp. Marseille-Q4924]